MLDVHPPHEPLHGWRDFLIHIATITIGLLIALGLEGCVEWQHHRHLVHEAERSLEDEIRRNAANLKDYADGIQKEQASLNHDVDVLKDVIKTQKYPPDEHMEVGFDIRSLEGVSWRTAQATGALSYMSYSSAQEFSDIYNMQDELDRAEHDAARDVVVSVALFTGSAPDDPPPSPAVAATILERIGILQGQLMLVQSLVKELQGEYTRFLTAHPQSAS